MSRHAHIRSANGDEYVLVPARQPGSGDSRLAERVLADALSHPLALRDLVELAWSLGIEGREPTEIIRALAGRVASGGLALLHISRQPGRGRPVLGRSDERVDWNSAQPLSALRESDPIETSTWVSIEVFDAAGVPFGRREAVLVHANGRRDRAVLDEHGRYVARDVPTQGATRVLLPPRAPDLELRTQQEAAMVSRPFADFTVAADSTAPIVLVQLARHYRILVEPPLSRQGLVGQDSLVVQVVDDRGQPLGGEAFELTTSEGGTITGTLDTNAYLRCNNLPAGECRLILPDIDAREWGADVIGDRDFGPIPPFEGVVEPPAEDWDAIVDDSVPEYYEHRSQDVADPGDRDDEDSPQCAVRVTFRGWDFDARVFLPVTLAAEPPTQPLDLIGRAAEYASTRFGLAAMTIGHSDAVGSSQFNSDLSAIRAKSLALYLQGDREGWADLATEQASIRDVQLVLCWLAAFCGVPCHPGPVDGEAGPWTAAALRAFRISCGLPEPPEANDGEDACVTTPGDWCEIFDAYDTWVETSTDEARAGSARIPIDTWLPCGERRPASDGQHRRVDLLLFDVSEAPTPDMDAVAVLDSYEIQDLAPPLVREGMVYTGVAKNVATRAIALLRQTSFALISKHIWARHVRQLAIYLERSAFRRGMDVKKLAEKTLANADRVTDQGTRMVFEKEFNRILGTRGETIIRVVVKKSSGKIVTAFPELTFMQIAGGALVGALVVSTAANVQSRFAAYLTEQNALEEAREGWFEFVADVAAGGSASVARDEDFVIFRQIMDEELARGRTVYEESVRHEDGMFHSPMTDEEAAEFAHAVAQEVEAFNEWPPTDDGDDAEV